MVRARAAFTTTDTGWFLAQPCSHDGIVATGTKADDANTSGARIGNDTACAVSASFTVRPTMANTHDSEYEKATMIAIAPSRPHTLVPIVHPTTEPDDAHQDHHEEVAHQVGERAAHQHRRARHRQRAEAVDEALAEVVGETDAGGERTEHDRLHEDAGHQEVHVGLPRRQAALDGAAEHVAEHQHEDDRLDGGEHQQLRVAHEVEEVAPRHRERVADRVTAVDDAPSSEPRP